MSATHTKNLASIQARFHFISPCIYLDQLPTLKLGEMFTVDFGVTFFETIESPLSITSYKTC
jgi:hypothetical protein